MDYCDLREETILEDDSFLGTAGGLAQVLRQEGRTEWHDEDPNSNLWRAILVTFENRDNMFALVLSFHHLVTDGMGAVAIIKYTGYNDKSNLGTVALDTASPSLAAAWDVKRLWFAQGRIATGPAFNIDNAHVRGRLKGSLERRATNIYSREPRRHR